MKLYIHITVYGYSWIALLPLMQEGATWEMLRGRSIKAGNRTTSKLRRQSEEMKKLATNDADTRSVDVVSDNVDHLKDLFPEAFTEGKTVVSRDSAFEDDVPKQTSRRS